MTLCGRLMSTVLDKLRLDEGSYFGRTPLDILRLIDSYLGGSKPVALVEAMRWKRVGDFVGCYEDVLLLKSKDVYVVMDIFGKQLYEGELSGRVALVGRDELIVGDPGQNSYQVVNFRTNRTYTPDTINATPMDTDTAVMINWPSARFLYNGGTRYLRTDYWGENGPSGKTHRARRVDAHLQVGSPFQIKQHVIGWALIKYGRIQCVVHHCAEYARGAFYCSKSKLSYIDVYGDKALLTGMTNWAVIACYGNYLLLWHDFTSEFHVYLIQI